MGKLIMEEWPIDRLYGYARNPRKNDAVIDRMKSSIAEFGFKIPILARSSGEIVDGHLRWKAAKAMGMETVPVTLADDLSDTQVKAFRLLANQSANWAAWDEELLKLELEDLKLEDFDISMIGFDDAVMPDELPPYDEEAADAVPEVQDITISRNGDIWLLGDHRLMCGDSTDAGSVALLMDGGKADMVFTDPPYGVSYEGGLNEVKREQIANDDLRGGSLYSMLCGAFSNIKAYTKQKAGIYVFYADRSTREFLNALHECGLKQRSILIWHKTGGGFGDFMAQYMNAYEPCIYASNGEAVNWYGPTNEKTVWEMDKEKKCDLHPTMKPVAIVSRAIKNSSQRGNIILDLFGGSGSTLIACEQTGRVCRMMELSEHYVDVIIRRWQDLTGKKAVLEGDGRTFEEIAEERG